MKVITYSYDNMKRAGQLLNLIKISGVDNIRVMAELSMILDSGTVTEDEEKEENDGDQ